MRATLVLILKISGITTNKHRGLCLWAQYAVLYRRLLRYQGDYHERDVASALLGLYHPAKPTASPFMQLLRNMGCQSAKSRLLQLVVPQRKERM